MTAALRARAALAAGVALAGLPRGAPAQHPDLRAQLDSAASAARRVARTEDAARAGYHRIARLPITDLNPFVGEHWIDERRNRSRELDLAHPAYLMYYPRLGPDSLTLVGVGYTVAQPASAEPPAGFAGDGDRWHVHLPCAGVPVLGGVLAESTAECVELGGTPAAWQVAMVHVWTVPNPDGPFAQFNPALPFQAVGIEPPSAEELHDPAGPPWRELGLALSETYGAVPRMGARIAQSPDSAFADRVRPARDRIRALVAPLRAARSGGDAEAFHALADRAVADWRVIRAAYLDAALSAEHRVVLERWFAAAVAGHHRTQLHTGGGH